MADGSGFKQISEEMEQAATDVAKDVKDEVGQMIEQGVQSVAGPKLTPQQIQQKELGRQKKLAHVRKWFKDLQDARARVNQQDQQKRIQRQQQEEQEKQNKKLEEEAKKKVIISPARKTPQFPGQAPIREDIALSRPELKGGHGKGG